MKAPVDRMNDTVSIKKLKQLAARWPDSRFAGVLRTLPDEVPRIQLPGLVEVWTDIIDQETQG